MKDPKLIDSVNQGKGSLDLRGMPNVKCEKCKGDTFKMIVFVKKISALLSPNGQEILHPIQAFACDKCGHVPVDIRKAYEEGDFE